MSKMTDVEKLLLDEIRLNRSTIGKLDEKLGNLDKQVFSNKIKLGIFIAGISLFFNIIFIVIAEKIKHLFT